MPAELLPIEAHERTIHQIFGNDYAFEIPPYQRPYAWEVEQARDLLGDLLEAMDNAAGGGGVYFLGSIVLIKSPNAPEAKVVDGQQRLTTLTILLSVLRDMTADPELRVERRSYIYQKGSPDLGTQNRFRLLLRPDDRPFFQKWVQDPDSNTPVPDPAEHEGSRQRILENAAFYRAELGKLSESRRDELIRYMLQRCYLVVVAVPTQDAARRIFTVLNARGMDLTATDILKAEFLEGAKADSEAVLAKRWEALEQALGRDAFVELFGHIRMIHERRKPQSALESAFANVVPLLKSDPDGFMDTVLEPLSDAYELLRDTQGITARFGATAGAAVRSLQRIDSKDWMPPALLKLWHRSADDAAGVSAFLIDLERLAYFLFITRVGVNDRMQRFAAVMEDLSPRAAAPPSGALQLTEAEKADLLHALDGPLYRKSRVCRPVLQRLDEALSTGGATYETIVSIEHVLPQTVDPGSEWAIAFPDDQVRADWTHRLANLVLLTRRINTRAYNWSFARKKNEYFATAEGASPFPLTQGVLGTGVWNLKHLQARQAELLSKLATLWSLTPASPVTPKSATAPAMSDAGTA